jgi:hypothetical protein
MARQSVGQCIAEACKHADHESHGKPTDAILYPRSRTLGVSHFLHVTRETIARGHRPESATYSEPRELVTRRKATVDVLQPVDAQVGLTSSTVFDSGSPGQRERRLRGSHDRAPRAGYYALASFRITVMRGFWTVSHWASLRFPARSWPASSLSVGLKARIASSPSAQPMFAARHKRARSTGRKPPVRHGYTLDQIVVRARHLQ